MPQDIRLGPDGKRFSVADMAGGGLHILGAHGITRSHDGTWLYDTATGP